MNRAAVAIATLGLAVVVASAAARAAPVQYGFGATKSCLAKHGTLTQGVGASNLSGSELSTTIELTMASAGAPASVYVVVAPSATAAATTMRHIAKALLVPPSPANSLSGHSVNAAWLVYSLVGQRPSARLAREVQSCLRAGSAGTGITRDSVAACIEAKGQIYSTDEASAGLPALPRALQSKVVFGWLPSTPGLARGLFVVVVVGRGGSRWLSLARDALAATHRVQAGTGKGVAWVAFPSSSSTSKDAAIARAKLSGCVS